MISNERGEAVISNEDVCNLYHNQDLPGVYLDHPFSLQIFMGTSSYRRYGGPGKCERHHAVFQRHQIIPEFCFGCHKVFIEPRTVMELFKLLILFEELELPNDNLRKCLTEHRSNIPGFYKGLVYCRGIEEGMEMCEVIRQAVASQISPHIAVNLKRGCAEFGVAYPQYASADPDTEPMIYDESWRAYEEDFDRRVGYGQADVIYEIHAPHTPYNPAQVFAMTYWLYYAATIGDDSYQELAYGTLPPIEGLKRPPFVSPVH